MSRDYYNSAIVNTLDNQKEQKRGFNSVRIKRLKANLKDIVSYSRCFPLATMYIQCSKEQPLTSCDNIHVVLKKRTAYFQS